MRVLIIAHGHPDFNKGGGELAAYNLFKELCNRGVDAYFLAAHRQASLHHGGTPFSVLRDREILFFSKMEDFFLMSVPDKRVVWHDFDNFLENVKPDIIHFHHVLHLGIQFLRQAATYRYRQSFPVGVVYTLHEYLPICANDGQMIMKNTNELCAEYSPQRCSYCFGDRAPEDFFLREKLIRSCLDVVDNFVSPSFFLKQAYEKWGLDKRISVIENGQIPVKKLAPRVLSEEGLCSEFAYLGQINKFKGLDVYLSALEYFPKYYLKRIKLHIYGSGLEEQNTVFRDKIEAFKLKYNKNVIFHGVYRQDQLASILSNIDTVVMPSIWWENSPLVIQEAHKYGRPVICSDIGGMREKVRNGLDGLHFTLGSPASLADKMISACDKKLWQKLYENLPVPVTVEESTDRHMELYEASLTDRAVACNFP